MSKRDIHRGHRGIQTFRAHREKGKQIAIACAENPALAAAFNSARAQGHDRDKAFEIAKGVIKAAAVAAEAPVPQWGAREEIRRALVRNRGNRTHTARELGIAASTLRARMKKVGLV